MRDGSEPGRVSWEAVLFSPRRERVETFRLLGAKLLFPKSIGLRLSGDLAFFAAPATPGRTTLVPAPCHVRHLLGQTLPALEPFDACIRRIAVLAPITTQPLLPQRLVALRNVDYLIELNFHILTRSRPLNSDDLLAYRERILRSLDEASPQLGAVDMPGRFERLFKRGRFWSDQDQATLLPSTDPSVQRSILGKLPLCCGQCSAFASTINEVEMVLDSGELTVVGSAGLTCVGCKCNEANSRPTGEAE